MLSQTTEYALRAMACLAQSPDALTPTPELAKKTDVPPNYLAKVLQQLSAADLITGRRGVGGGYRLSRSPAEIRFSDVINAVSPIRRFDTPPSAEGVDSQSLGALYTRLDDAAKSVVDVCSKATLADVVSSTRGSAPMGNHQATTNNGRPDGWGSAANIGA
ncbi:MAG: Rrf2 family transcriptional regulator [Phycisphaerales bacterium]|nr:Rrf2 family transcriptional regulator [Phycisphaerales bacterium]